MLPHSEAGAALEDVISRSWCLSVLEVFKTTADLMVALC